mmetsp:Transcript_20347/g.49873  ORF Transcript_20347/g.49873 Transcript_20347/m.49873 type:complete len:147 (-) Transcript_20347:78-518(-)|eukprot:CAMPEP_0198331038 /NCGR_PEP_ID=MMETSP1450-20131203/17313_1 /TAXON_ID=753684 ORGANISM="Madagascaria erythrocladiodes, Strain CCMP3234" /NCGR_SAMPLE_ID=MMETSP1450 /ASSEMBLY_ACC=CAM_ASM_001115 /LENGTH=146 /DNA_ID=CAMNT_0044035383 /DNA_START=121 /DNA_END=561 /DNA_ORIENTATION=+
MSDGEDVMEEVAEETPVVETEGDMDIMSALQEVLKMSLIADGLARGLNECAKALDHKEAQLCVLAQDCDEASYTGLIEALCAEMGVNLVRVPERKQLGEWAGLCKIDEEGNATKVVGATCVVVKDFGKSSKGLDFLLEYLKSSKDD